MGEVRVEGKRASIIKSYGPALKVTCEVCAHSHQAPPAPTSVGESKTRLFLLTKFLLRR